MYFLCFHLDYLGFFLFVCLVLFHLFFLMVLFFGILILVFFLPIRPSCLKVWRIAFAVENFKENSSAAFFFKIKYWKILCLSVRISLYLFYSNFFVRNAFKKVHSCLVRYDSIFFPSIWQERMIWNFSNLCIDYFFF